MIRLGLRLTFGSGREAALRVLVTAAAVALGVGMLLAALAGYNGLHAQTDAQCLARHLRPGDSTEREIQRTLVAGGHRPVRQSGDRSGSTSPSTGPNAPVPPGLSHLPGPGEYCRLARPHGPFPAEPANELRDGFPGSARSEPSAPRLCRPRTRSSSSSATGARQLSQVPGAVKVGAIQTTPASCYACQNTTGSGSVLQFILAGGAVALLLPVLILIATASRLSAARREERFAAMRLVGATPRQVAVISAVEAVVAAFTGVAAGFALFFVFRPLLYHVPFTGAPLPPGDLSLHLGDIALAVVGVPLAAIVSARLALRRVQISPLGVTRRASSRPPRIVRIIPLLAGIAVLAYFDAVGKPGSNGGQILELLVGFVFLIAGLVLAGPWFTTAGSRIMAKRASRPAVLIVGRRLLDNPKAAFRFISGLVIALFIASAAFGALSSTAAANNAGGGNAGKDTIAELFCSFSTTNCPASSEVLSVPDQVLTGLRVIPGVLGVTVVHQGLPGAQGSNSFGIVACGDLEKTPAIGKCAPGASVGASATSFPTCLGTTRTRRRASGRPRTCRRPPSRDSLSTRLSWRRTGPRVRSNEHRPCSNRLFPSREPRSQSRRSIRRRRAY